jgi:hypothetical protein
MDRIVLSSPLWSALCPPHLICPCVLRVRRRSARRSLESREEPKKEERPPHTTYRHRRMYAAPMIALLAVYTLSFCALGVAEKLDQFTFQPPFEDIDLDGSRLVGDVWKTSGSTVVGGMSYVVCRMS